MLAKIRSAIDRLNSFEKVLAERDQAQAAHDSLQAQLGKVLAERDQLQAAHNSLQAQLGELYVPPGHFFSPLPALDEIRREEAKIFGAKPLKIPGIDLRESEQLALLRNLARFYPDMPFQDHKIPGLRYYFVNDAYTYGDGILLYCMVRHLAPKRIIEVGSGYSSCLLLDTNDLHFDGAIELSFIEPYPQLLRTLISTEDHDTCRIIPERLQDMDLKEFENLKAGDILFIDSTHVSKINSDVNFLFFEILPRLASGVYIHLHDIFWPFEYPKWWVYEGRGWNESYLLRAFLQYNQNFSIVLMGTYLRSFHQQYFEQNMPLCLKRFGGSIWLRKD